MDVNNYNDIVCSLYKLGSTGYDSQDVRYRKLLSALNGIRSRRSENDKEWINLKERGQNPFNSFLFNILLNQINVYINYITKSLKAPKRLLNKCNPLYYSNKNLGKNSLLEEYNETLKYLVSNNEDLENEEDTVNPNQENKELNSDIISISDIFHRRAHNWGPDYFWIDYKDNLEQNKLSFFLGAITNVKNMTQYIIQYNSNNLNNEENQELILKFEQLFRDIGLNSYLELFRNSPELPQSKNTNASDTNDPNRDASENANVNAPSNSDNRQLNESNRVDGHKNHLLESENGRVKDNSQLTTVASERRGDSGLFKDGSSPGVTNLESRNDNTAENKELKQNCAVSQNNSGDKKSAVPRQKYDYNKVLLEILKLEKKINLLLLQKNVKSILNLTKLINPYYNNFYYYNNNVINNNYYYNYNTFNSNKEVVLTSKDTSYSNYKKYVTEYIKNSTQYFRDQLKWKRKLITLTNKYKTSGLEHALNAKDPQPESEQFEPVFGERPSEKALYENLMDSLSSIQLRGKLIEENSYLSMPHSLAGKLRNYQIHGLNWLLSLYNNKLNGILADEMGLGKTIQTIALLVYLRENKGINGCHIIIAPVSTLHSTWKPEIETWYPNCKLCIYEGTKEWRKTLRNKWYDGNKLTFDLLLTSDTFILKDKNYLKKICYEYLIIDEAHRIKSQNSKIFKILNQYIISNRRLLLTGTPLQNDLSDLWTLVNFIMPQYFNNNNYYYHLFNLSLSNLTKKYDYTNLTKEPPSNGLLPFLTESEQTSIILKIHQVLKPYILRREKSNVLNEVPIHNEYVICCPLSGIQTRLYEFFLMKEVNQNKYIHLKKIINHPYLYINNYNNIPCNDFIINSSGKMIMLDLILSRLYYVNHRVLIFSQMTSVLDILEIYLNYRNYKYLRLDGSTSSEKRFERLNQFNKPNSEYFIFILSTKAGSLGINLQSADTVIIYDSDWNPQNDIQAQSRVHRIGQKNKVISIRLITPNTVEENLLKSISLKLNQNLMILNPSTYQEGKEGEDEEKETGEEEKLSNNALDDSNYGVRTVKLLNDILSRSKEDLRMFHLISYKNFILNPFTIFKQRVVPPFLYKSLVANKKLHLTDDDKKKLFIENDVWNNIVLDYEVYSSSPTEKCLNQYVSLLNNNESFNLAEVRSEDLRHIITNLHINYPTEYLIRLNRESYCDLLSDPPEGLSVPEGESTVDSDGGEEYLDREVFKLITCGKLANVRGGNKTVSKDTNNSKGNKDKEKEGKAVIKDSKGPKDGKGSAKNSARESKDRDGENEVKNRKMLINKAIGKVLGELVNSKKYLEFNELPSREYLPDYYEKIKNPICLLDILSLSSLSAFESVSELKSKLQLLASNARNYNGTDSFIFHKALNLVHEVNLAVVFNVVFQLIERRDRPKALLLHQLLSEYFK